MGTIEKISFARLAQLDTSSRLAAAYLVMASLPAYYMVDGIDDSEMVTAVAELVGKPGSEIERGFVAIDRSIVVGILTFLDSDLLQTAQLVGTQALLKYLPQDAAKKFRDHLRKFDAGFGSVPDKSVYLGRFAIAEQYRGSGLANRMIEELISRRGKEGNEPELYSLHVHRENDRALTFYRKNGFRIYRSGSSYFSMIR